MDLPEITEVKRLAVRPGDRLVVKLDRDPTPDEADRIAGILRDLFEDEDYVPAILVVPAGTDVEVIEATKLTVDFGGNVEPFIEGLRRYIRRHGGGSVQNVLGSS